jgi:hypothetical protein
LVAEVTFAERTDDGLVRHASFQGLREDKPAEEVRDEQPVVNGTNEARYGSHYLLTGLTAGTDYNARMLHRVSGGTGTLDERTITVVPTS